MGVRIGTSWKRKLRRRTEKEASRMKTVERRKDGRLNLIALSLFTKATKGSGIILGVFGMLVLVR